MNGHLDYSGGLWRISDLKPHISIRFKDVFKGVPFGSKPPFFLRDNASRATDLQWFMSRYPLTVTDRARDQLKIGCAAYSDMQSRMEELRSPDYAPGFKPGFREGEAPEKYQMRAAEILRSTGRLLLMDDVGLGKTISFLASVADGWGLPAAVIVQPHLSTQWAKEYIERFTHLSVCEVKDRKVRNLPAADIYLFRYSNIGAWVDYAEKLRIKTVCFDEVQELRHGQSTDKGRAAQAFCEAADNRIGLTATPIYNYGSEIWNVVEYIAPGALGTWSEFTTNWCTTHGTHWIVKDPAALGAFLIDEGIAIRRQNEDPEVSKTLPPLYKNLFEVEWNEGDAQTDRELQMRLAQRVLSGSFQERGSAARELDLLLRQETGIAKARAVAAYTRTLVEAGEKVLLGGWHREVYRIWNEALRDLNPVMYTGSESQPKKRAAKDEFINGASRVMMMSLRSGAGLDGLQHACAHVVYGELDWSPQVHTQFTGRVRRRGQTRDVTAHFLHTNGGSDPVMIPTLGLKSSQSHGILNPFATLQSATPLNSSRMKELATSVLEQGEAQ